MARYEHSGNPGHTQVGVRAGYQEHDWIKCGNSCRSVIGMVGFRGGYIKSGYHSLGKSAITCSPLGGQSPHSTNILHIGFSSFPPIDIFIVKYWFRQKYSQYSDSSLKPTRLIQVEKNEIAGCLGKMKQKKKNLLFNAIWLRCLI